MQISASKKTSFYIDNDNKEKMKKMVSERKQSEFINNAIRSALEEIERRYVAEQAIAAIDSCPFLKSKKTATELVREVRNEKSSKTSKIFNKK